MKIVSDDGCNVFPGLNSSTGVSANRLLMSSSRNFLFVVHRVPFPPDRGDRIRSYHLLRYLSSLGNVWLATLADEPLHPQCLSELRSHSERLQICFLNSTRYLRGAWSLSTGRSATEGIFHSSELQKVVCAWSRQVQFDAAIGFCSSVAQYLDIPELKNTPRVIDLVDVDSEKFAEYSRKARGLKRLLYAIEARRLRRLEVQLGLDCDGITLVTEPEAAIYRTLVPEANVKSVTNGIDLDYYSGNVQQSQPDGNQTCVFVGALDYPPNIDGLEWFCKEVWPQVQVRCPTSRLLIVGRNPAPEVKRLARLPGVQLLPNVPDVRPYYQQACVAIAPLRITRGLQNKVLEGFAMRTAVLSTPNAVEGIDVSEEHVVVESEAEKWVEALITLFTDEAKRRSFGEAGYQFVEANHSWASCLQPFAELLNISEFDSTVTA